MPPPRPCRPAPVIDAEGKRLLELILRLAGLTVTAYREPPLQRRLAACLRALGTRSPAEAIEILERFPQRHAPALDALLIGVTGLFRDPPLFAALQRIMRTDLLLRRRPLRVLSVGCSDGAELYSVAMLLVELGGPGALAGAELLGTDCRPSAIEHAAAGLIGCREVTVPVPSALRHLERDGATWRVAPQIRRHVRFACADALEDPSAGVPGGFDLVLCRNLVIYLAPEALPGLWARLLALLSPGGYLAVGKAERVRLPGLRPIASCLYRNEETADAP
jgi:chemotaxis protein methyltransferase CheR